MKKVFYIEDTPENKISYYFMLVFLVTLPFDRLFSELALIGLLFHTFLHSRKRGLGRKSLFSKENYPGKFGLRSSGWLTASLYGLTILGTIWSVRRGEAAKEWEKQLAFILFPLIFFLTRLNWVTYRLRLLKAFAFSCLITTLYLYGMAWMRLRQQGLSVSEIFTPSFMNHQFALPIDLHATYFSMYIAISLVTLIWLLFDARSAFSRAFYAAGAVVLLAAMLQLAARAVCISLLLIVNGLLPFWMLRGKARVIFICVSLSLTAVVFAALIRNENLHTRYLVQLGQDLKGNVGDKDGPEPRVVRWRCAWELIRTSPWIGYGTGAEVSLLKERYAAHRLYDSYAHELNAHNQYLSLALKAGLPGVVLFLGVLLVGFLQAARLKDPWLGGFLVIIVCVSFSENILDVNKGIFFFSFFFNFLFVGADTKAEDEKPPIFVPQYGNKNSLPLVGA